MDEPGVKVVQFLAFDRVGVYVIDNQGESMTDFSVRLAPYAAILRETLDGDSLTDGERHKCIAEFRIDSRDRNNWDRMADWLDDRRQKYEQVLRNGPADE